jgi:hypothetical protein
MVPYLVVADLQNTVLSAVLVFSDKLLYPSYAVSPGLFGFTPQEDQAAAGAIMWVVGSLVFVVPAILIAIQCLSHKGTNRAAPMLRREAFPSASAVSRNEAPISRFIRFSGNRLNPRTMEAISFVVLFFFTAAGFAMLSRLSTDDDNQVLRATLQSGAFAIAVYGPAGDVPIGPTAFAVLVEDRASHEVLLDSDVELSLRIAHDDGATTRRVRALPGDDNKLLYSARLDLDSEGRWLIDVAIRHARGNAAVSIPIEVVKAETGSACPWSYIVTLAFAVVLRVVYVWRHAARNSSRLAAPIT